MITRRNRHHAFAPAFCAEAMEPRVLLSSATLVKDIDTSPATSTIQTLGNIGNWAIFAEDDGMHGVELYRSNATTGGTFLLKDINPGPASSNPQFLATVGKTMFFSANDGTGVSLWKTDGNIAGTVKLKNVQPSDWRTTLGSTLFFSGTDSVHGNELWKSDGTAAGTKIVRELIPGAGGAHVEDLIAFNNAIYFTANDGKHGVELWKSDTVNGTKMLADLTPGNASSSLHPFRVAGNALYFADHFRDNTDLRHLYMTTGGVPSVVASIDETSPVTALGNRVYFNHNGQLWRTDGTTAGTKNLNAPPVNDFFRRAPGSGPLDRLYFSNDLDHMLCVKGDKVTVVRSDAPEQNFDFGNILQVGNNLYFAQVRAGEKGEKLLRSDGTAAGTVVLKEFAGDSPYTLGGFVGVGNEFYFISGQDVDYGGFGDPSVSNPVLWKSDGTIAGTVSVKSLPRASSVGTQSDDRYVAANKTLFFTLDDSASGRELWKSDGTSSGTRLLRDIFHGTFGSNPQLLTPGVGGLYFNTDGRVWIKPSDSAEPVVLISDHSAQYFRTLNGIEIIESNGVLYRSDGTKAGTQPIFSPAVDGSTDHITHLTIAGSKLYFNQGGTLGDDLWVSDGTSGGTRKIEGGANINNNAVLGNTLLFARVVGHNFFYQQLWRTDGTVAGTKLVKDVKIESPLYAFMGAVYFLADDPTGVALFKSDGNSAGTKLLMHVGSEHSSALFAAAGNTLFFLVAGSDLWKTDGTTAGTKHIKQVITAEPYSYDATPPFLAAAGNHVFFAGSDATHGHELWTSDGTTTNTKIVRDIHPGIQSSLLFVVPHEEYNDVLTTDTAAVGNMLYFAADDGTHGIELWKTDGTKHGTAMVQDINPKAADSWPQAFAVQGSQLLFGAADALHGRELWQLPLG